MIVLAPFGRPKGAQKASNCDLRYFLATKSNQKLLGYSPSGQILKRHKAAPNLQATQSARRKSYKEILPAVLMFAFSALLINPKP